jgi:hypothetical protein
MEKNEIVIMPDHIIRSAAQHVREQFFLDIDARDKNFATFNKENEINTLRQRWDVITTKDFPDIVRIMNRQNKMFVGLSKEYEDVLSFSVIDPDDDAQKWRLVKLDDEEGYALMNQYNNKRYWYKGIGNWKLFPSTESSDLMINLEHPRWKTLLPQNTPKLFFAVLAASPEPGTELVQWVNEYLSAAGLMFKGADEVALEKEQETWHGYYHIITHCSGTKSLVLTATASGGKIVQQEEIKDKSAAGRGNQLWRLEQLEDGNYLIINKSIGQAIESTRVEVSNVTLDSPVLTEDYDYKLPRHTDHPLSRRIKIADSTYQGYP